MKYRISTGFSKDMRYNVRECRNTGPEHQTQLWDYNLLCILKRSVSALVFPDAGRYLVPPLQHGEVAEWFKAIDC